MKKIFVFLLGLLTGIVITIGSLYVISKAISTSDAQSKNNGLVLFDKPGEHMNAKAFKVFQVLDDAALANAASDNVEGKILYLGPVVLIRADEEHNGFYDDQIIKVPSGKVAAQIGTYQYYTRQEIVKTVPVIGFISK